MAKGYKDVNTDIGEFVRKAEEDFTSGVTHVSKYVDFNFSEDINKIYAYLESKHTEGANKEERPFFNISLARRNIWYRATDIDRSNIKIRATKGQDDVGAMLATVHLQDWMRRENFGSFLNAWGINSAGFNESVLKFVEKGKRLMPSVVPWHRIFCDSIDFKNNPKIEILEMTEAQLRRQGYDQELVDELCDALAKRETTEGEEKDNKDKFVKLYEIHGEFSRAVYKKSKGQEPTDGDDDVYFQQMHVITFVATKEKGKYDDYTLYSGKEEKDPYMLAALLPEVDGSIALRGAVKTLFDSQWMQNHTAYATKKQLDLASLLLFQTSDPTFVGQNALNALQNGDILIHKVNEPLTMLNNKADIAALQNFGAQWKQLGDEITGVSDAMLGIAPKSGTAWRQTEAQLQESHSLFELMTENRGLSIVEMMRVHVIPFLKKQMDTSKEITATLAAHDISKIDAKHVKNSAIRMSNAAIREKVLNGEEVTKDEQALLTAQYAQETQAGLQEQGNQRFFKPSDLNDATWKEVFKDLEWDVEVDVTNENVDKDAASTLNTLLQFFQAKQGQPLTPEEKFVVEKILRLTGTVSPVELAAMPTSPPVQQGTSGKLIESMAYKDTPDDIKRQMEQQAGFKPSSIVPPPPVPGELPDNKPTNASS